MEEKKMTANNLNLIFFSLHFLFFCTFPSTF